MHNQNNNEENKTNVKISNLLRIVHNVYQYTCNEVYFSIS